MSAEHRLQANLNELPDAELVQYLTYYYHFVKDREQAKQNDPQIQIIRDKLREAEATYNQDIKDAQKKIKAARALCQLRGLTVGTEK